MANVDRRPADTNTVTSSFSVSYIAGCSNELVEEAGFFDTPYPYSPNLRAMEISQFALVTHTWASGEPPIRSLRVSLKKEKRILPIRRSLFCITPLKFQPGAKWSITCRYIAGIHDTG